jgi:hypothetical protein
MQRHARRTGITALSLLVLTATAAVVLARVYRLGVAATVVALLGGIPSLYLAWAAYRDDRAEAGTGLEKLELGAVADELAVAVRAQWAQEAGAWRLNDPFLPVGWVAADPPLADDWMSVIALAAGGAGWPAPPADNVWAIDPAHLAGEGGISEVLARIPTRRLVVVGEAGAGKTMLLVGLVLDLLARRGPADPVPMLFSLASWSPAEQDLRGWLAAQIAVDHPALAAPAPAGGAGGSWALALLEHQLILPVLDGLDELPQALWARRPCGPWRSPASARPCTRGKRWWCPAVPPHTRLPRPLCREHLPEFAEQPCWNCGLLMPQLPAITCSTDPPTRMGGFRFCRPSEPLLLWAVP